MYRYNRYITRHLIHSVLLITFSLTSIVWLTQALRFIDFIVNQGVSIVIFMTLTALLIPSLLFMILPAAMFCSVLFVYNKLRNDSELVVMQASGLSNWRLAKPALQVAFVVMVATYAIALYLLPVSYKQFRDMQVTLRNSYASIFLQDGVFTNPVEGLTVFARERDKDGVLHGILVHDTRQPDTSITMMADTGKLVVTPEGPRFLLMNGNRQEMRQGRLSFLTFTDYTLDMSLYSKDNGEHNTDPQELFIDELFTYDPNLSQADNNKHFAEGHQRLIWPGFAWTLTMVALAVLFNGQFNRRGHWKRITLACLLCTGLLFSSVALRGLIAMHPQMVPIAYLNLILPCLIAMWLLGEPIRLRSIPKMEGAAS